MLKYTHAATLHSMGSLIKHSGTREREICNSFVWYLNYDKKDLRVVVPQGYVTDMGSIPRFLFFLNPTGYVAYILHDWLYTRGEVKNKDGHSVLLSRRDMDIIMRDALLVEGMSVWRAWIVYWGVRLFGWYYVNTNLSCQK